MFKQFVHPLEFALEHPNPRAKTSGRMLKKFFLFLLIPIGLSRLVSAADEKVAPTGPQTDGSFHKVILDADRDTDGDGKVDDVLVDPMEIAIAKDGRVFYIERAGTLKIWKPE